MVEIREAAPARSSHHSISLVRETRQEGGSPAVLLEGRSRVIGTGEVSSRMNPSSRKTASHGPGNSGPGSS